MSLFFILPGRTCGLTACVLRACVALWLARRILNAQCTLLKICCPSANPFTAYDYGLPKQKEDPTVQVQVFEGNLPSIKMSHRTIMANSPKKGPSMHDTPPKPS